MRLFSFGGYGLALAALVLVVFGAYDSYPKGATSLKIRLRYTDEEALFSYSPGKKNPACFISGTKTKA